jgi:hypothetical protein
MFCKVTACRFAWTHVTKGHRCGVCGNYGHGELECFNERDKLKLEIYCDDRLPNNKICTVADCTFRDLHTVDAHHCPVCKKREPHTIENCPRNTSSVVYYMKCPVCRVDNTVINPKKIFGLKDECCICYDNAVEILFPSCYHCCICLECLHKSQ